MDISPERTQKRRALSFCFSHKDEISSMFTVRQVCRQERFDDRFHEDMFINVLPFYLTLNRIGKNFFQGLDCDLDPSMWAHDDYYTSIKWGHYNAIYGIRQWSYTRKVCVCIRGWIGRIHVVRLLWSWSKCTPINHIFVSSSQAKHSTFKQDVFSFLLLSVHLGRQRNYFKDCNGTVGLTDPGRHFVFLSSSAFQAKRDRCKNSNAAEPVLTFALQCGGVCCKYACMFFAWRGEKGIKNLSWTLNPLSFERHEESVIKTLGWPSSPFPHPHLYPSLLR